MTADCPASPSATVDAVRSALDTAFARLDGLCGRSSPSPHHRPAYPGAWTAAEHLEHVALANHFLLLTIGKGVATALRRAGSQTVPPGESDLVRLSPIADPDAFPWEPPGHMIPTGVRQVAEMRELLAAQHRECLAHLERMAAGEGRLCSFRMSVCRLGMLDMYQWLFFLANHGFWHLAFLERREPG